MGSVLASITGLVSYPVTEEISLKILDSIASLGSEKLTIVVNGQISTSLKNYLDKTHSVRYVNDLSEKDSADILISVDGSISKKIIKQFKSAIVAYKTYREDRELAEHSDHTNLALWGLYTVLFFNIKPKEDRFFTYLPVALGMLIFLLGIVVLKPFPPDDLLRHLVAYKYSYDYGNMYPDSWNFSYEIYPVFDRIYGILHSSFGDLSIQIVQFSAAILAFVAFIAHQKKNFKVDPLFVFLVLGLFISLIGFRMVLGRPTIFVSMLFLLCLVVQGPIAILLSMFIAVSYYFWFIYLIPLVFYRKEHLVSLLIGIVFWLAVSNFTYFSDVYTFSSLEAGKLMEIAEESPIFNLFVYVPLFVLVVYFYLVNGHRKYLVPIVLFALINKIRFIEVIVPLVLFSLIPKGLSWLGKGGVRRFFCYLFAFFMIYNATIVPFASNNVKLDNSRVFSDSMTTAFDLTYNSENISVSPGMCLGCLDKVLQAQIKTMGVNGTVDCSVLRSYGFTHVVESSLNEIPECLELQDIAGKNRIWKIKGQN